MDNLQSNSLTIDDAIKLAGRVTDWKLHEDDDYFLFLPASYRKYECSVDNLKIIIDKETIFFLSEYSLIVHSGSSTLFESKAGDKTKLTDAYNKICSEYLYQKSRQEREAAQQGQEAVPLASFKNSY